ncbi:MAG: ribosome biogenesis GTPase Der [Gemmatimonadetes bacterium]|nr:ribosome biogenesis GTPase Der [Gemmatimonadota bacterium]
MSEKLPVIAVVGRPNVGKSTFFNRVVGARIAIVDDQPGVTRDRNFAKADWAGHHFLIVDTGGIVEGSDEPLDQAIRTQALMAVSEADLILFLVDGKAGLHPLDERLAEVLRKTSTPVLLVVNKMDNLPTDQAHQEFWSLGIGEPIAVSSLSGKGSGDLLDLVLEALPEGAHTEQDDDTIRVAVVGKPNVGKSSYVNRLIGEDRVVVSDMAGTTRDPIDTPFTYHGKSLVFVDTAGLRRQSKIKDNIEYYSAIRADRVVHTSDVCVVLIDGSDEEVHAQDVTVLRTAWDAGKAVILLVNKWDLVEKETMTSADFEKKIRARLPFMQWVPILFVSALTGQRVRKVLDTILEVHAQRHRRVDTHEVNEVLDKLLKKLPAPMYRGRRIKIKYATQATTRPPTFAIFANYPKSLPEHYIRFLHNGFREAWRFMGTPIRLHFRGGREE